MRLGSKRDLGPNVAIVASILAILGAILFVTLVPKPTVHGVIAAHKRAQDKVLAEASADKQVLEAVEKDLASWTWEGGPQQIGPTALNSMSVLAKQNRVKLSGFRPQRSNTAAGLELLPFAVTAEGASPDVLRFVQSIENSGGKLAIDRVQVASSEANSNRVTAVVGLTAFRLAEVAQ